MKSKAEELESIEKSIIALDNHYKNSQLDKKTIARFQTALDKTADKIQYDDNLGSKRFRLYEMQALIEIAKGNFSRANNFINDAGSMMEANDSFLSVVLDEYIYNNTKSLEDRPKEEGSTKPKKMFNGKLEGWLALYTLRLVLLPIFLLLDALSVANTDTAGYDPDVVNYLRIVTAVEAAIVLLAFICWYYYFNKMQGTKTVVRILEASTTTLYLGAAIWLTSIYSRLNVTPSGEISKFYFYGVVSVLWLIYWDRSKRVKSTFTNE